VQNFMIAGSGTALEGVPGNTAYSFELDNPNNKAFVAAWKAKFNRVPTDNEGMAYVGAQVIFEGVRKAKSVKAGDVAKAVRGATLDTVHGQVVMRAEDNQLMLPNYIVRAKAVDGQLRPVLERTFPASIAPPPSPACKM
jgi:branched-chain amino acid transport system substrate-binding protein